MFEINNNKKIEHKWDRKTAVAPVQKTRNLLHKIIINEKRRPISQCKALAKVALVKFLSPFENKIVKKLSQARKLRSIN